jgi:hypothetical protein
MGGAPAAEIFGPARVLEVDAAGGRIQVMLTADGAVGDLPSTPRSVWAERAMPFDCELGWGDCVLVAGSESEDLYVIGVLGSPKPAPLSTPEPTRELALSNGMRAESPDGESLSVYAPDGRVLFRHDGASGSSRIDLPGGDVEFVAPSGSIDFVAAEKIRFTSREAIELSSLAGVRIAAHDALKKVTSLLSVTPRKVGIGSEDLDVQARKAEFSIDEASYRGQRLSATLQQIKSVVKRSESVAETLIEKAKNSYRSVEALSQLSAGRVRSVINGTYELKSKNAFLKSDEDFKIDGEKIHLG